MVLETRLRSSHLSMRIRPLCPQVLRDPAPARLRKCMSQVCSCTRWLAACQRCPGGSQHVRGALGEGNLPAQSMPGAFCSPEEGQCDTWRARGEPCLWVRQLHAGPSRSGRRPARAAQAIGPHTPASPSPRVRDEVTFISAFCHHLLRAQPLYNPMIPMAIPHVRRKNGGWHSSKVTPLHPVPILPIFYGGGELMMISKLGKNK
jgi:hypothetical protein